MKLTLTLVVILALVSVSQAAIVKTIGEYSIDVTADTASPASPGLTAYIVTVKTVQGLYGADARVDALNGAYLNQEWGYDGTAPTPSADIGPGQPFRSLTPAAEGR